MEDLTQVGLKLAGILVAFTVVMTMVAYTVLAERRVLGFIQGRLGPNRVGPGGFLQPLADLLKFIFKEDIVPDKSTRFVYFLAPVIATTAALMTIVVYPFGPEITLPFLGAIRLVVTRFDVASLYVLGVTSVGVYGVALSGWSSNSKYSLLGGLRASAQMVSYEIALGLSLIGVLIMAESFSLRQIVDAQAGTFWGFIPRWNIFQGQFVAFFIYLMAAYAETNRIPFDLPEAETELVAGYHTEYSAMKFAMFFMAEYANMITVACLATLLFLGGWSGPRFGPPLLAAILPTFWFVAKVFVFLFVYIWVRGTLPRFRYDQLMAFGWKFLFPLAIANLVVTALIVALKS